MEILNEARPFNVARSLAEAAENDPYRAAIYVPQPHRKGQKTPYEVYNFTQLNRLCDSYARGFWAMGMTLGERALMMVPPGLDLIAITFALLRMGCVPVLIDPGMGRQAFLQCVKEADPGAFIGIPPAHLYRLISPGTFRRVKHRVSVGMSLPGAVSLEKLRIENETPFPSGDTTTESEAAIAFTSGSTGPPKGVVYLHGMFGAMIELLRTDIGIKPGEIDIPGLYILALLNPALGVTTVLPEMDVTRPAQVDAAAWVEAIRTFGVTNSFGSPTIWKKVNQYCREKDIVLPSMRRVLMAGASVPTGLVREFSELIPKGEVFTPYGATEALPVTNMAGTEIRTETAALSESGAGVCVGRPTSGTTIRIIPISEEPISIWKDDLALAAGEIGEIVVKGTVVTREYLRRPEQNALSKIADRDGIWHRMGDLGYLDEKGRLWVCGRKAHRVETAQGLLLPDPCEEIFNHHPDAARSALVGVGKRGAQLPVMIIEPRPGRMPASSAAVEKFRKELLSLAGQYEHTRAIRKFLFHPAFPVDVRHNVKIQRERLAVWAEKEIRRRGD